MEKHSDGIDTDLRSPATEQVAGGKVKLITVHGTGAGDVTAAGDRWWQLGSAFLDELGKRLDIDPSRIEISPFQWKDGPNSEEERRDAGKNLYQELKSYDESGDDYYLVGHSHGGSVVYSALLQSVVKEAPLKGLKYWCTVGTPFLDYRPNRLLFQRLKNLGLTLYTTGVVAFVLGAWVLAMLNWTDLSNQNLSDMGFALLFYGIINYSILWAYERYRKTWFTQDQKKQAERLYSGRWLGLWHLEDEAISALTNIKEFSAPIIPRTFLRPVAGIVQFLLVIAVGIFLGYDLAVNEGQALESWAAFGQEPGSGTDGVTVQFIMICLAIVVLCIPAVWLLTVLLNVLANLLGKPLAWVLNGMIWSSVKQRAWGDDVVKEDVFEIGSHPPEFAQTFGPLPDAVANQLRKHSEKHAILTLHKVREVLGMTRNSKMSPDLRSELSENLTWQELIHTSYFDVPEFIDLVALGLHGAGLAEFKEEFSHLAERKQLVDWCNGSSDTSVDAIEK